MEIFSTHLLPAKLAQVVRPYDPDTMTPPSVVAEQSSSSWPMVGLVIATAVVVGLILFVIKKRKTR